MTDGVRPVGPVQDRDRRAGQRRTAERRAASGGADLIPVADARDETPDPASSAASGKAASKSPADPAAAFAAQVIGQSGQKRGLKGGPPVLDAARGVYLGTEYSGENDRRPPTGLLKKTDL